MLSETTVTSIVFEIKKVISLNPFKILVPYNTILSSREEVVGIKGLHFDIEDTELEESHEI